ncbi:MAG TPA: threonine synthase [Blastocatellia bacterium]|nr:threonine synthase [Blastocatellia bacterium]
MSSASLRCIEEGCLSEYPIHYPHLLCSACGGLLDVQYSFHLPLDAAGTKAAFERRKLGHLPADLSGVWRFHELLPFAADLSQIVTLGEGNTPVYEGRRSAEYSGLESVRFKHQGMNPTGSFKDNGMTTGVTRAREEGAAAVACASTGNTSASMAAYAARAGMRAIVFVPAGQVAYGKLAQALEYGATVVELEGNFDDAMRIVREFTAESGVYLLNSLNPFRLEGQKTIMIELMEQCGWRPPDWIVLPGGNLGNASAFGKALHELAELGFIKKMPRLAVIQAEGAAPFYELAQLPGGSNINPVGHPVTLATAIRIGNPVSWKKALRSLAWTGGVVEAVSEQEIADAKAVIGRDGIGCEPASAASLAGARRLVSRGLIERSADVICVLTGNLLKDPDYTIAYHSGKLAFEKDGKQMVIHGTMTNRPVRVAADKDAIKRTLDR